MLDGGGLIMGYTWAIHGLYMGDGLYFEPTPSRYIPVLLNSHIPNSLAAVAHASLPHSYYQPLPYMQLVWLTEELYACGERGWKGA